MDFGSYIINTGSANMNLDESKHVGSASMNIGLANFNTGCASNSMV